MYQYHTSESWAPAAGRHSTPHSPAGARAPRDPSALQVSPGSTEGSSGQGSALQDKARRGSSSLNFTEIATAVNWRKHLHI